VLALLAAVLFPLHFTAPGDTIGPDPRGHGHASSEPVASYEIEQLDARGRTTVLRAFADSLGKQALRPHRPGTRECVWVALDEHDLPVTLFVVSRDGSGNASTRSNGLPVGATLLAMHARRASTPAMSASRPASTSARTASVRQGPSRPKP